MSVLRFGIVFRLAQRDLWHGWQSTACLTAAVTAALIPLLLLYGLKFGVVNTLIDTLRSDPRILELRLVEDTELGQDWFDALEQDGRVGFLLPRARYLATSVRLRAPKGRSILEPRLIPTAGGDPLLAGRIAPQTWTETVITARVQIESGVEIGDQVELIVMRIVGEDRQAVRVNMTVTDVVPRDLLQTDDIFVTSAFETAVERYREGYAVPEFDWPAANAERSVQAGNRTFASFRLYAADIRDVPSLRDTLLADGFDVETRAEEIETTLAIEQGLGWVFLVVSTLAAAGFLLTLGLHLAASVVEKARELSLLRLLGLSGKEIAILPSIQGATIGLAGALCACVLTGIAQPIVNGMLDGLAGLEGRVSQLNATHFIFAIFASSLAGGAAGSVAGFRSAKLEQRKGYVVNNHVFVLFLIAMGLAPEAKAQSPVALEAVPWCQIDDPATWRINRQALIDEGTQDLSNIACNDKQTGLNIPLEIALPLPCGRVMMFRRIDVPVAHSMDHIVGNFGRAVDIAAETPQTVLSNGAWQSPVAGAFTVTPTGTNGTSEALGDLNAKAYYMGKYEVTEPQWQLYQAGLFDQPVNETDALDAVACTDFNADLSAANLRIIPAAGGLSWYDMIDFSRAYSDWLVRRDVARIAAGKVPDLPWEQGATGYVRPPFEAEWEYAARGGASFVTAQERSTRLPAARDPATDDVIPGSLANICAETPRRDGVFLNGVGQKMPNVLGLYDTVCNAEEIVLDLFRPTRPDGLSGQVGGVTTKGGTSYRGREQNTVGWRNETAALFTTNGPGSNATMGTRMAIAAPVFAGRRDDNSAFVEGMNNTRLQQALLAGRQELLDAGVGLPQGESDDLQAQVNQLTRALSEEELTQADLEARASALQVELERLNVSLRSQATEATRLSIRSGIVTGNLIDRVGRNMYLAMDGVDELLEVSQLTARQNQRLSDLKATILNNNDRINASFDLYLQVHTELATRDEAFVLTQIAEARRGLSGASVEVFGENLTRFEQHQREIRNARGAITEEIRGRWLGELDTVRDLRREQFPEQQR